MSAYTWLAKLNISPEAACRCGHNAHVHSHGKDCTAVIDESRMTYCKCQSFREATQNSEGDDMSKEKKQRKPKGEGRKPSLAPFVDSPFKIYIKTGGKEYDAQVLSSGIIKIDDKEFTSPSSAGSYMLGKDDKGKPRQIDGWKAWTFNKDGERVPLDTLRGSKSPLKAEAPKPKRTVKAKSAKAHGPTKPKRVRKTLAVPTRKAPSTEPPTSAAERQENSTTEATA